MKKIYLILFLFFSSSIFSKTFKDIDIEGLKLGESLLNHMDNDEIFVNAQDIYHYIPENEFLSVLYKPQSFQRFEFVNAVIKKNDNNFIIYGLGGVTQPISMEDCFKLQNKMVASFDKNLDYFEKKGPLIIIHPADSSNLSKVNAINYIEEKGTVINIECYDFSENVPYVDSFSVNLLTEELNIFLNRVL